MRIAFEESGGKCILTCEIDSAANQTYRANFSPEHNHEYVEDIFNLSKPPRHDVLVAGFPCQPYSIAGLRKGLKDKRGQVFTEIVRILNFSKPSAFLLENVKGMTSHDKGKTFKYLIEELESCGYTTRTQTLNSMTHSNIPQNRERVFIVGFREPKKAAAFEFPEPLSLRKSLHECIDGTVSDQKYFYDSRFGCYKEIRSIVKSPDVIYQWRRQYVRENKSGVCPALTANMGSGGHNVPLVVVGGRIRKLTPRECANFQGFPKSFNFPEIADTKLYHQIGNSVTVPLIMRLAKEIARLL